MSKKELNLIILAGDSPQGWYNSYNSPNKASLPLAGKHMLDWVIESFHKTGIFRHIVVVGAANLDYFPSMKYVKKRVTQGFSLLQNLIHAVLYTKIFIYKMARKHPGYVISFCDAPLLTKEAIENTLKNIVDSDADIVLHYVEKSVIAQAGLPTENRSYMDISGKKYTGANIYYIRKCSILLKCLSYLSKIRKVRKDPNRILDIIGCRGKSFPEIEQRISSVLKCKARIFTSSYYEMGVDVDKPSDYAVAQKLLTGSASISQPAIKQPQHYPEASNSGFIKLACFILAVAAIDIIGGFFGIEQIYAQSLQWIKSFKMFSPFVFLGLYIIMSGILLPSIVLKISAGFLFGITQGIILVTIGTATSSVIKFLLARYWCREAAAEKIKQNKTFQAIDQLIEKNGWKILLLLNNIPIISSMCLHYICGLSSMKLRDFIFTSSLGKLPSTILYVYLGCVTGSLIGSHSYSTERIIIEWVLLTLGIIALAIFSFYCRSVFRNSMLNLKIAPS